MSVSEAPNSDQQQVPSRAELMEEVERILRSPGFSGSEVLRNLLSFLVKATLENGDRVKEYEIATEVLGRRKDFDPRIDSTVRVHTGRLRSRLTEYYAGAGASDPVAIDIPKGAYHLNYLYRPQPARVSTLTLTGEVERKAAAGPGLMQRLGWAVAAAALALAAYLWLANRRAEPPELVRDFWAGLTRGSPDTMVVFSNPLFIGSAIGGMRYATRDGDAAASPSQINDRYTGTGEAVALHEITQLFEQLRKPMRVKRSLLLTWDEARHQNLVFIGGPDVNGPIADLPRLQQFDFKTAAEEPRAGVGAVRNLRMRTGEQPIYFCSGSPYTLDYAVVGLVPGAAPHRALICAGNTTYGTQAAVEFVLREDGVRALLAALKSRPGASLPWFEALIKVKISGGVPVQPELVTVHERE